HTDVHPGVEIPQPEAQRALIAGGYSILTYGHVFLMESGLTSFTNIHFSENVGADSDGFPFKKTDRKMQVSFSDQV
ncbi:MAG: hypothetical protein IKI15_11595, partial [Lachnospiraceae bacterium]|nr:hypothetical protein [Lachnospiraceae bacterium]